MDNERDYLEPFPDLQGLRDYVKNNSEEKLEKNSASSYQISDDEFYEYLRTYPNFLQMGFSNKELREKLASYNHYFKQGGTYENLIKYIKHFDMTTLDGQLYWHMLNYARKNFSANGNSKQSGLSKRYTSGTFGSKLYAPDDKAAFTSVCMLALLTFLFETLFLVLGLFLFH